jgi:small subunit ribosomal protein S11
MEALGRSTCRVNELLMLLFVCNGWSVFLVEGKSQQALETAAAMDFKKGVGSAFLDADAGLRIVSTKLESAYIQQQLPLTFAFFNHIAVAESTTMNVFSPLTKLVARSSTTLPSPLAVRAISSTPFTGRQRPSVNLIHWLDSTATGLGGPPDANSHETASPRPHRMHIYATKHNTHITFTQAPKKDPANPGKEIDVLMSLSTGNIGFKKAGRGTYDAAHQLAAFVIKQIQERGLMRDLHSLEVVLRGFGKGREAVPKVLLGSEGYLLRSKITSVKDATRLKFGGSRSPKPRRLG